MPNFEKKRILICDDEVAILTLLKERLEDEGYLVSTSMTAAECIELSKTEKPDLIIVDLVLPDMYGSIIIRRIKESADYDNVPIIMFSGFIHGEEGKGVETPADAYIPKPFDVDYLLQKVREFLFLKEQGKSFTPKR